MCLFLKICFVIFLWGGVCACGFGCPVRPEVLELELQVAVSEVRSSIRGRDP